MAARSIHSITCIKGIAVLDGNVSVFVMLVCVLVCVYVSHMHMHAHTHIHTHMHINTYMHAFIYRDNPRNVAKHFELR